MGGGGGGGGPPSCLLSSSVVRRGAGAEEELAGDDRLVDEVDEGRAEQPARDPEEGEGERLPVEVRGREVGGRDLAPPSPIAPSPSGPVVPAPAAEDGPDDVEPEPAEDRAHEAAEVVLDEEVGRRHLDCEEHAADGGAKDGRHAGRNGRGEDLAPPALAPRDGGEVGDAPQLRGEDRGDVHKGPLPPDREARPLRGHEAEELGQAHPRGEVLRQRGPGEDGLELRQPAALCERGEEVPDGGGDEGAGDAPEEPDEVAPAGARGRRRGVADGEESRDGEVDEQGRGEREQEAECGEEEPGARGGGEVLDPGAEAGGEAAAEEGRRGRQLATAGEGEGGRARGPCGGRRGRREGWCVRDGRRRLRRLRAPPLLLAPLSLLRSSEGRDDARTVVDVEDGERVALEGGMRVGLLVRVHVVPEAPGSVHGSRRPASGCVHGGRRPASGSVHGGRRPSPRCVHGGRRPAPRRRHGRDDKGTRR